MNWMKTWLKQNQLSTINAQAYIGILDNFLITSIENWFGDDEVIFLDDGASGNIVKEINIFTIEKAYKIMEMDS